MGATCVKIRSLYAVQRLAFNLHIQGCASLTCFTLRGDEKQFLVNNYRDSLGEKGTAPVFPNEIPRITKYAVYAFITTMPKDDDNDTTCTVNALYSEKRCPPED